MTQAASRAVAITAELTRVMQADRGRLLSALTAQLRNLSLAEDVLQEATLSALTHWGRTGLPASPQGWLLQVARRKAIDRLRQTARATRNAADLTLLAADEAEPEPDMIPDERLRLIFTCCHPALEPKSQVALTLRTLGGLSTTAIAAAFLDNDTAMGARLTRAKAKIAAAGIPFAIPDPEAWPARLQSVLTVVYLIFTSGYVTATTDLASEAIFLARLLTQLAPNDPEIEGCLALLLITHARHTARVQAGVTVALPDQDRSLWDQTTIAEGLALIDTAMTRRNPGPYQIKAAIAACHVQGATPDWPQIALLYGGLLRFEPTAVVRLNHAVALAEAGHLPQALTLLAALEPNLAAYQPYHAARAEYLTRQGDPAATTAYDRAIELATNPGDAAWLTARRDRPSGEKTKAAP